VGHHSPLYQRTSYIDENSTRLNVDWAVNYWINSGFPREKMILGLATYGRVFKLKNSDETRVHSQNNGAGTPGEVMI
jgi:chitinase